MLYCGIHGKILTAGERKKQDGTVSKFVDVYIEECGGTVRVHNYHGEPFKEFGEERTLAVKVYASDNSFYITHAD